MRGSWFCAAVIGGTASGAVAQSVSLSAAKDNTIYQQGLGTPRSNGAGSHFIAGATGAGSPRRGLIQFDLADQIPQGATITGVTLQLRMSRTISGNQGVSLHRALKDWGAAGSNSDAAPGQGATAQTGDATWEHTFFNDQFWDNMGGDFEASASATTQVAGIGTYGWSGAGLVDDVEGWLSDPSTNFGWFVIGNELAGSTAKRFDSSDNSIAGNRPRLIIEFDIATLLGDMDGNGELDAFDVAPFELALADREAYAAAFPDIDPDQAGDMDDSGALDAFDVAGFELALAGGGASSALVVPEPGIGIIALAGMAGLLRRRA